MHIHINLNYNDNKNIKTNFYYLNIFESSVFWIKNFIRIFMRKMK